MFPQQQQQDNDSQIFFLVKGNITSSPGLNGHESQDQKPSCFGSSSDTTLHPLRLRPCATDVDHGYIGKNLSSHWELPQETANM